MYLVLIVGLLQLPYLLAQPLATDSIEIYGPIKSGELLWDIALKLRPNDTVSRYQTMQAILAVNPHAFSVECNSNSPLKTGELLRIPTIQEIQKLTAAEARRQFSEQTEQWRAARKSGEEIQCPRSTSVAAVERVETVVTETRPVATPPAAVPETISQRQEQRPPLSPILSLPPPHRVEQTTVTTEVQPPPPIPPTPPPSPVFVELPKPEMSYLTWLEQSAWVSELKNSMPQLPLWIIVTILGLLLIIVVLLFMLILLLLRRAKNPSPPAPHYPIDTVKSFSPENNAPPKMSSAVWGELPTKKSESARGFSQPPIPPYDFIEQQLAHIRSCLANEGETQAVRILLHEVMTRGTQQQQAQAEQLLDIARKMHWLEERSPRHTDENTENPAPQQEEDYFPLQRYLPEEQARIFEIIDKIFGLLDKELSANGQLVEAYMNRYQREDFWDTRQYKVIDKVQTPLVDPDSQTESKGRDPKTAPRHL
ncbi:hypothetical protein TPSD3_05805 [Thioflexithrix psekupsensis]|uniref:LysM domain-containing protein n=2 Tax=Thioflexithrix psekupsensis TaxID=1570016 RepID=A0A251X7E9_9GAMM|nr:hypothetical protein TPSD3_05805 [Thioflexithrix psekupsensis]